MTRFLFGAAALGVFAMTSRADEPADDVRFHRMLQRTTTAARQLEFTQMASLLVRQGANMGPADGWFKPAESRYGWKWLSAQCGDKTKISPKDFSGPPELFARLDRDRDGYITAADLNWSDSSPYFRQMNMAQQWLRLRSKDGRLSRQEWDDLFEHIALGKDYLDADDVRTLMNPPMPPAPPRKPGPGEGPPSKALLLQGLFTGEIGSMYEGPRLGQKAPDFTLPAHDGKKVITLSQFAPNKPVVLIFGSFT